VELAMGLDQWIYRDYTPAERQCAEAFPDIDKGEEIWYWRKNYPLNEWICNNACPDDLADFNCEKIYLYEKEIDHMFRDLICSKFETFKDVDNFYYQQDMLQFIIKAKELLSKGHYLYYLAWW